MITSCCSSNQPQPGQYSLFRSCQKFPINDHESICDTAFLCHAFLCFMAMSVDPAHEHVTMEMNPSYAYVSFGEQLEELNQGN